LEALATQPAIAKAWPVALLRKPEGKDELEVTGSVDVGWSGIPQNSNLSNAFLKFALTDDWLVVGNAYYGLFWIISLEDGKLRNALRVYPEVTDALIRKNAPAQVLLNYQPLRDGRILIAGRDPRSMEKYLADAQKAQDAQQVALQGVADAASAENAPPPTGPPDRSNVTKNPSADAAFRLFLEHRSQLPRDHPLVFWFELDPAKGRIRQIDAPLGARPFVNTNQDERNYFWLPDKDDHIRYYSPDLKRQAEKE
jgi:hypothetical protein